MSVAGKFCVDDADMFSYMSSASCFSDGNSTTAGISKVSGYSGSSHLAVGGKGDKLLFSDYLNNVIRRVSCDESLGLRMIYGECVPDIMPDSSSKWTTVWSNGYSNQFLDLGKYKTDNLFKNSLGKIIVRFCSDCATSHRVIYYQRISPIPEDWSIYSQMIEAWTSDNNILDVDFKLYSSWNDLQNGNREWHFCNYDDTPAFPRDCGPDSFELDQVS